MNTMISIITPVYNGTPYIVELIRSVLDQDYVSLEHIIIDDGSTDKGETVSVLERYPHLRWWSRENRGQYATMNEGLLAAKGEVVCFISADDLMSPGSVRRTIDYLNKNTYLDGVYGNYAVIDGQSQIRKYYQPFRYAPTFMYPYTLHISHSSLYLRREALLENNLLFNDCLRYVGDYDWIVRLLRSPLKLGRLFNSLSMIRIHEQQTSTISFYQMREETFMVQKELRVSPFFTSLVRKVLFASRILNITLDRGINPAFEALKNRFANLGNQK